MDEPLLKKYLLGDSTQVMKAISMLYDELAKKFLGHLFKRGLSTSDAEDVIQNLFLKIANNPSKIANAEQIYPYIWRMLFNSYNDFLRNKKSISVEEPLSDNHLEQTMSTYVQNDFLLENCIGKALDTLRKQSYDKALVIELSTLNGWKLKDIAVFVDKTYGATREFVSSARKKLQDLIYKFCGDDVLTNLDLDN